jgi:hypothetical protein
MSTTIDIGAIKFLPDTSLERIVSQYKESPRFQKWVNLHMNETNYLCGGICSLVHFFDIEKAGGEWLDVLGRIVGQPRAALDTASLKIFTLDGAADEGLNEGVFTDGIYGVATVDASDVIYRRMIKARALKNAAGSDIGRKRSVVNDVVRGVEILTGGRTDFTIDNLTSPMQFGITFDAPLDATSYVLLVDYDLLARPLGVELVGVVS